MLTAQSPGPGEAPKKKLHFPEFSATRMPLPPGPPSPTTFPRGATAVRPVTMALFPAFAAVSEAPDGGNSRKGKHTGRMEKASFFGPGLSPAPCVCLAAGIPRVLRGAAKPSGKGSGLALVSAGIEQRGGDLVPPDVVHSV